MKPDVDLRAALAAYLRVHGRLRQDQIGELAGLGGQSQVSKLIARAKEKGYLREVFAWPPGISEQDRRIIEQSCFPRHDELERALFDRSQLLSDKRDDGGARFQRLHIVPLPDASLDSDEAFRSFGLSAAEIAAEYIDKAKTCAVAWGRTIQPTLKLIREHDSGSGVGKLFLPICGEPTNHPPNGISPSDAAQILSDRWPGSRCKSLRGVQARIPKSIATRDTEGIARKLVAFSNSYREIFVDRGDGGRPLIANVDMILTGIGDASTSSSDPWYLESADAEDREVLALAAGNLGGAWVPRAELSATEAARVYELNDRWLGAQLTDFRRCARRADVRHQRPGVVVLAVETTKAEIILEALDLISVLIVSHPLACELERQLLPARKTTAGEGGDLT